MWDNPLKTPKLRALGPGLYFLEHRWRQTLPDGRVVTVPQGVRVSFESAPGWFWRLISPLSFDVCGPVLTYEYLVGRYTRQLDFQPLCETDDGVRECRHHPRDAIIVMRMLMYDRACPWWKRWAVTAGIRLLGPTRRRWL